MKRDARVDFRGFWLLRPALNKYLDKLGWCKGPGSSDVDSITINVYFGVAQKIIDF